MDHTKTYIKNTMLRMKRDNGTEEDRTIDRINGYFEIVSLQSFSPCLRRLENAIREASDVRPKFHESYLNGFLDEDYYSKG